MSLREEAALTLRNPRRVLKVLDSAARRRFRAARAARLFLETLDAPWQEVEGERFLRRRYASYADYVHHQRTKVDGTEYWVTHKHDPRLRSSLADRMRKRPFVRPGISVLCLGARTGGEVQAFRDLGCFAVGIDLNPGPGTEYVLTGDFHHLLFPDGCVDLVYCNSLDHVFDVDRFSSEARRVLRATGVLVLELAPLIETGGGRWESFAWRDLCDLVARFQGLGFELVEHLVLSGYPWDGGDGLVFALTDAEG